MTTLESQLSQIWAEVLGLDRVGLDEDFFQLGGDSLAAVTLFDAIIAEFGRPLPYTILLELSTVRELAAQIASGTAAPNSLVPIQPSGTEYPLFAVHDLFGGIFFAKHLSDHLGQEQPVFALRPPQDADGNLLEDFTLESLSAYYVEQIRAVHGDGPYRLYGCSFGGVLAFEVALQLQQVGAVVDLLAIGDAAAPAITFAAAAAVDPDSLILGEIPDPVLVRARKRLASWRSSPTRPPAKRGVRILAQDSVHALQTMRRRFSAPERARRTKAYYARAEISRLPEYSMARRLAILLQAYRPATRFEGPVLLIETLEDMEANWGLPPAENRGWQHHATGAITSVLVRCAHAEIADEPYIGEVAAILSTALSRLPPPQRQHG